MEAQLQLPASVLPAGRLEKYLPVPLTLGALEAESWALHVASTPLLGAFPCRVRNDLQRNSSIYESSRLDACTSETSLVGIEVIHGCRFTHC